MNQPTSSYDKRRMYHDEPYLRAEHLLHNGKYAAVTLEITDIVYGCPKKKMGSTEMGKMIGLAFKGTDKVLGLAATNESLVSWITGCGSPSGWVGKKVQLVVRLAGNKKEPAIRVWPGKAKLPPNNRIKEQMGDEITDAWYEKNGNLPVSDDAQDKPKPPPKEEPQFTPETRAMWLATIHKAISEAKTTEAVTECRARFTKLGTELVKHKSPLTDEERRVIAVALEAAVIVVSKLPPAEGAKPADALL